MPEIDDVDVAGIEVRAREHVVLVQGDEVPLSSREFDILSALAEHPGWVYSASQLSGDSEEGDYSPESVSVLVSRIRHKLAAAGADDVVETVRGVGYRLRSTSPPHIDTTESEAASRELRDAAWQLQEAVIEVGHSGTVEQRRAAVDALDGARRTIFASLAE